MFEERREKCRMEEEKSKVKSGVVTSLCFV